MRIAVVETDNQVEGPGEGKTVVLVETAPSPHVIEEYENPALKATSTRGIWMIKSAIDRGAEAIIVAEAGAPAFNFIRGKATLYMGREMSVTDAINAFTEGKLPRLDSPSHEHMQHHGISRTR